MTRHFLGLMGAFDWRLMTSADDDGQTNALLRRAKPAYKHKHNVLSDILARFRFKIYKVYIYHHALLRAFLNLTLMFLFSRLEFNDAIL